MGIRSLYETDGRLPMHNGILTLTAKEKETLRLLVSGHDAKSIARHLGLSVHTINERLRDARRKLDVASSREAARLLADAEQSTPETLTDKLLGVAGPHPSAQANGRPSPAHGLAWLIGGTILMLLFIAALALSSGFHGFAPASPGNVPAASVTDESASASLGTAREWLALLDRQSWEESWRTAATLFKSQITAAQWASTIGSVRQPLGEVSSRTFQNVIKAKSLPGAPAGEYEVIQFQINFANQSNAEETVTLARDGSDWRVAGYFIR